MSADTRATELADELAVQRVSDLLRIRDDARSVRGWRWSRHRRMAARVECGATRLVVNVLAVSALGQGDIGAWFRLLDEGFRELLVVDAAEVAGRLGEGLLVEFEGIVAELATAMARLERVRGGER